MATSNRIQNKKTKEKVKRDLAFNLSQKKENWVVNFSKEKNKNAQLEVFYKGFEKKNQEVIFLGNKNPSLVLKPYDGVLDLKILGQKPHNFVIGINRKK